MRLKKSVLVGMTALAAAAAMAVPAATAASAAAPAAASATTAITYYSWSHSTTGASVTGGRWWYYNGRLEVDGYLNDTKGDNASAVLQLHFVKDCCSNKIKNSNGVGSKLYFHKAASATGTMQFRTQIGVESSFGSSMTAWKYYSTWQ